MCFRCFFFFFNDTATTEIYTLSLHDALPIAAPDLGLALLAPAGRRGGVLRDREVDAEAGALPRRRVHFDAGAVLLHQSIDRREAQAGPPPRRLGGEERLEHPPPRLLVPADAGVADVQEIGRASCRGRE